MQLLQKLLYRRLILRHDRLHGGVSEVDALRDEEARDQVPVAALLRRGRAVGVAVHAHVGGEVLGEDLGDEEAVGEVPAGVEDLAECSGRAGIQAQ